MKINFGKFIGQLFSGKSPVDVVLADINAQLDRVEAQALLRAKAGEDLSKVMDDVFGLVKELVAANVKKAIK